MRPVGPSSGTHRPKIRGWDLDSDANSDSSRSKVPTVCRTIRARQGCAPAVDLLSNDAEAERLRHGRCSITDAELLIDVAEVSLHSTVGNCERYGDVL